MLSGVGCGLGHGSLFPVLNALALFTALLVALGMIFAGPLVTLYARDYAAVPGKLELTIRLRNDGFAAPFNPRPFHVVLSSPVAKFDAKLSVDARKWESGEHKVVVRLSIPSKAPPGDYRLSLALPDDAASLRLNPRPSTIGMPIVSK